eukprot:gene2836-3099_t
MKAEAVEEAERDDSSAYLSQLADRVQAWAREKRVAFKLSECKEAFMKISPILLERACALLVERGVLTVAGGRIALYQLSPAYQMKQQPLQQHVADRAEAASSNKKKKTVAAAGGGGGLRVKAQPCPSSSSSAAAASLAKGHVSLRPIPTPPAPPAAATRQVEHKVTTTSSTSSTNTKKKRDHRTAVLGDNSDSSNESSCENTRPLNIIDISLQQRPAASMKKARLATHSLPLSSQEEDDQQKKQLEVVVVEPEGGVVAEEERMKLIKHLAEAFREHDAALCLSSYLPQAASELKMEKDVVHSVLLDLQTQNRVMIDGDDIYDI